MSRAKGIGAGLVLGDVLVIDQDYVYGPFKDKETAIAWTDAHRVKGPTYTIRLHMWVAEGNMETAHSCGIVLRREF